MPCKGICIHHKASGRYATGHKRCQICDLFIKWDGVFCPCCGSRLRIGPRSIKSKAKLRNKKRYRKIIIKRILCYPYSLKEEGEVCHHYYSKLVRQDYKQCSNFIHISSFERLHSVR
jgi:hypothetical protein